MLTNIYHDSSSENERRYYIEGPFEKDIVSQWRGRFLHYIVMRALLHPIVGGCLPSVVQAAYMTAAMKIFVEGICKFPFCTLMLYSKGPLFRCVFLRQW